VAVLKLAALPGFALFRSDSEFGVGIGIGIGIGKNSSTEGSSIPMPIPTSISDWISVERSRLYDPSARPRSLRLVAYSTCVTVEQERDASRLRPDLVRDPP
jgi:hypothetical protein